MEPAGSVYTDTIGTEFRPEFVELEQSVLTETCGTPIIVVLTKTDDKPGLSAEEMLRLQYQVRKFCLTHGAALVSCRLICSPITLRFRSTLRKTRQTPSFFASILRIEFMGFLSQKRLTLLTTAPCSYLQVGIQRKNLIWRRSRFHSQVGFFHS